MPLCCCCNEFVGVDDYLFLLVSLLLSLLAFSWNCTIGISHSSCHATTTPRRATPHKHHTLRRQLIDFWHHCFQRCQITSVELHSYVGTYVHLNVFCFSIELQIFKLLFMSVCFLWEEQKQEMPETCLQFQHV